MIKNNNLDTHRDMTAKAVNYFCDGGFQPVQYPLGRLYRAAGWVGGAASVVAPLLLLLLRSPYLRLSIV